MDLPELRAQIEREGFPAGTVVDTFQEGEGRVFRVTQGGGRGLELLLTGEAVRIYGEGPTLALVLGRLRECAEAGLPDALAPGEYTREVFVGD